MHSYSSNKNRQFIYNKINTLLENKTPHNKKISENIEKGIYNNILDIADEKSIIKTWENDLFKNLYVNKAISIYSNLKSDSYLNNKRLMSRLLDNEFFQPLHKVFF